MKLRFTKMQGAGNDFVVLDETRGGLHLSPQQIQRLADRHFGVGADQVLSVRPAPDAAVDFEYVIHNADGGEVEHCGNGARCFVRYVREHGLTDKRTIRVRTVNQVLELSEQADGLFVVGEHYVVDTGPALDGSGLAPCHARADERLEFERHMFGHMAEPGPVLQPPHKPAELLVRTPVPTKPR